MILGIDAHCIRGEGGSLTHLREVLRVGRPWEAGFSRVVLWSGFQTLDQIEERPWLEKRGNPALDKGLLRRTLWSATAASRQASQSGCAVLWLPGCSFIGSFRPFVAMSRNMLPFDWAELKRFGLSRRMLKFLLLRVTQGATYRRADGMIYVSEYAKRRVGSALGLSNAGGRVIAHGIEGRYFAAGLPDASARSKDGPFRLLYVSTIDAYKHQWAVIEAVAQLQSDGMDVEVTFAGRRMPGGTRSYDAAIRRFAGRLGSVRHIGHVENASLHRLYADCDVFVFASSCENLPNTLLEAMAAGRPIACSSRGPMPDVLRDAGLYFDPEQPAEIALRIRAYMESPSLREEKAALAVRYAQAFSWERCASESFHYLADVANGHRRAAGGA